VRSGQKHLTPKINSVLIRYRLDFGVFFPLPPKFSQRSRQTLLFNGALLEGFFSGFAFVQARRGAAFRMGRCIGWAGSKPPGFPLSIGRLVWLSLYDVSRLATKKEYL